MVRYKSKESEQRVADARKKCTQTHNENKMKRIESYLKNPKTCLKCKTPIDYDKRRNDFCSQSCSAIYHNPVKKKKTLTNCLNCGNKNKKGSLKYCSRKCERAYSKKELLKTKTELFTSGKMKDEEARRFFRKITFHKCSICKLEKWNGEEIPLEVDHIDGNSDNNFPKNFRFVCRNCGALLPTHGAKNKGKGRKDKRNKWYFELMKLRKE